MSCFVVVVVFVYSHIPRFDFVVARVPYLPNHYLLGNAVNNRNVEACALFSRNIPRGYMGHFVWTTLHIHRRTAGRRTGNEKKGEAGARRPQGRTDVRKREKSIIL